MRFIFRPTIVYLRILEQALTPQCLRSGIELSIQFANLCRAFMNSSERPKAWPILAAEFRALEQLDVPYFGLGTDDTALTVGVRSPIDDYFQRSGYDEAVSRIRQLNQADLARQIEIIRGSVYCGVADVHAGGGDSRPGERVNAPRRVTVPRPSSLEREAQAIAEEIRRRSIRISPDQIDWVGLSYFRKTDRMHVDLLGDSLFDGRCGIALFLAAYARIVGDPSFRDSALEAIYPLRQRLHTAKKYPADEFGKGLGIGGATGLGSIIYSLATVGRLLGDAAIIADAQHVADLLTDREIESDRDLDVVNGAAGAALSLLALHRETGDLKALRRAAACGTHLLRTRAWDVASSAKESDGAVGRKLKLGFAHGNAGIWYSLLSIYSVTRELPFFEAAEEILAVERAHAQWPIANLSSNSGGTVGIPTGLVGTWCNGIPGIGMSRLGALSILTNGDVEGQIEAATRTIESWPLDGVDHMCCGNFGRIEALLVASKKLSIPRLRTVALKATAWVVSRAQQAHRYRLQGEWFSAPHFDASFFHGAAGIGYGLLRAAHPEALPCVLLWE
jgi:type 2 lantibiotic biosynthesis protein LanM